MKALLSLFFAVYFISFSAIAQTKSNNMKHTVEAGQTLYFISKKYNLSISDLRLANPAILDDLIIKPEQSLLIPKQNIPVKIDDSDYKVHIVKTKETLFSISQQYGLKVADLIAMNNLDNPNINIGQELKIQRLSINDQAIFIKPALTVQELEELKNPTGVKESEVKLNEDLALYKQLFESYNTNANILMKDKGIGNYLDGSSSGAYLAMVNNVASGQIIKVRNLMNNKVIYLKVVGDVSKQDADKNVSIKISKSAANDLNIIEDRFLAEWTWYKLDNANPNESPKMDAPFDDF
jgi:LysM repeat protein